MQRPPKKLLTAERSLIGDNIWFKREYFVGATAAGKQDAWRWKAGVFSGSKGAEFDNALSVNYFGLLSGGYDFAEKFGVDQALVRLDYIYQEEPDASDINDDLIGTAPHEHVISLSYQYENGAFGTRTDLAYAKSFDGNELFGFELMPYYDITDMFQVVGSWTYINSAEPSQISLSKYEKAIATGKVETANQFYAGLNTYFYGHKLKWQNGVQYTRAESNDYDGWGFTSAFRLSW